MNLLCSKNRPEIISRITTGDFDLLVVGGGITGAGIALDAAARGIRVALLEKSDFASGTSSKSTKLIHGGLRYLKQFEINLVREVGRERAIVHRLALHLVKAEKMLLPIVKNGTFSKWATSVGLWVYDFLAGVKGDDRRKMLSKEQVVALEPHLRQYDLLGGGLYAEYRTDDARLTIELVKTAVRLGAICLNYAKVDDFIYRNGKITGLHFTDELTGTAHRVAGKVVVSAAGPWVDELRKKDNSLYGKRLFLSKGVHVVVPHHRLPLKHAVYFDLPDGRMMFAIPRWRKTYLGTTDTPFEGNLDDVHADSGDVEYILAGANAMFPKAELTAGDVESSWAGLRPLIYEDGKSASEMSRKDEVFKSETGLISIAGGKLTGYRKMAERVVDLVALFLFKKTGTRYQPCLTDQIPLTEIPFNKPEEVADFQQIIRRKLEDMKLPAGYATALVENYGRAAAYILNLPAVGQSDPEVALATNELAYCLEHELVMKPLDFFERRSGRLYFHAGIIHRLTEPLLRVFQLYFGWDEASVDAEKQQLESVLKNVSTFT
jgi:glycerol-3-phosphate dehydrogenase